MNRRSFLSGILASGPALAKKKPQFDKPLGVQLYTVRNTFPHDPEGVIQAIAKIGYKEAEVLQANIDQVMPLLKANGMTAPSGHFDTDLITGKRTDMTWSDAIDQAKKYGLPFMVMPYLAPAERGNLDSYRALADKMNKAGEQCASAGIQFCYHNHAFEFEGKEGERPWDVLNERWDKKLVQLEVDVFWVSVAGHNAAEFLRKYTGRVPLVHLKDEAFGTPVQFNEQVAPGAFREIGTGTLDIPAILRSCEAAGVKHYIVEQDQSKGNPVDSLRVSYNNLRKIDLKVH
jgi:sugar phosphate isomerase/epimerase